MNIQHISIDPKKVQPPTRDRPVGKTSLPDTLPDAKAIKIHPSQSGGENASIYFVGTATTIL